MRKILALFTVIILQHQAQAQGCVAIRSNGGTCTMMEGHDAESGGASSSGWSVGLNNRYFRSFRHFVGTKEQKQRLEQGSEVINHTFSSEIGISKTVNARFSFGLYVPVINNKRSSLYEHDGKSRHSTSSFGLGDMRLAGYYWLTNPARKSKLSLQLGLGLKLPTGDYKYQDYFYKNDSVKVLGPVDQSIQLGDGGTGLTGELNAFYRISRALRLYANGFYLLNPREHNGVSTARGALPSATAIANGSDVMSVPDQYMWRAGASIVAKKLSFSAGMRMECVPAHDLVGGSNGFRRPGYVLSVEPVAAYRIHRTQVYLSVPWAVERNRTQSVPDEIRTRKTGVFTKGDAAFADYSVNFGVAFAFK